MELTVTQLSVARGGIAVLENLSFSVAQGRALILRGPNGVGKTTLLRCLAGLAPARAGQISAPPEAMAYAGHADGVKPVLSTAENLRFWAAIHGAPGIGAALDAMDLTRLADRPAQELSAGESRRLGLARLILTARPIWLLDEPTVALDAASVALLEAALATHLATGGSALIATHGEIALAASTTLDLTPFRARPEAVGAFEAGFQ